MSEKQMIGCAVAYLIIAFVAWFVALMLEAEGHAKRSDVEITARTVCAGALWPLALVALGLRSYWRQWR